MRRTSAAARARSTQATTHTASTSRSVPVSSPGGAFLYRVKPLRSLRRVHPSRGSVADADSARFELWHAARAETATNYLQCRTLGLGPAPHLGTLPFAETAPSVRSPASVASSPVEPEPRSSIAPCGALAAQPSIPLSAASRSYRCLPQNCHSRGAVFADRPRAYATNRSYAPLCSQEKVNLEGERNDARSSPAGSNLSTTLSPSKGNL